MDPARLGTVCRALRIKKRWRQADVAARAGVSRALVWRVESGRLDELTVDSLLRIVAALGGRIDFVVRWQGVELNRLMNARHSALHEGLARFLRSRRGWEIAPEVSFAIRSERGVIDILAWHAATRTLLVIELKTDIVDISELMGTLDRKRRLAPYVARQRGWDPLHVGVWLVVGDSSTNRRRVRAHQSALRASFPSDGRTIEGWLERPQGPMGCLSFWADDHRASAKSSFATVRRVRVPRTPRAKRGVDADGQSAPA
jgi:transcriptional regulator with XRE-family HTH domain